MDTTAATLFIYNNAYHEKLLACSRIEIAARPVVYTKTRYG